jgi:rod shape-determining protein MreC
MKRAQAIFSVFFIFIILSVIILFFFQNPLTGVLQSVTLPIQRWTFSTFAPQSPQLGPTEQELVQENKDLRTQLTQMQELKRDNQALHDQFQLTSPAPKSLLPAQVIGLRSDALLIDKGSDDNLKTGDTVVVKNNLIGKISQTTSHISLVTLITSASTSFTAKTSKTGATGVVKAQGGDSIILDNVVLSDKLEKNDTIVTKGDLDGQGNGYPPDLLVGKMTSVNKKASNLFQSAKVESLVDFTNLQMVFVKIN